MIGSNGFNRWFKEFFLQYLLITMLLLSACGSFDLGDEAADEITITEMEIWGRSCSAIFDIIITQQKRMY